MAFIVKPQRIKPNDDSFYFFKKEEPENL
jgi:hypothetical protein